MENVKERLNYLDYTKGFAILLVVLGHIYKSDNIIKIWIYSFHMPLFFIISGFFANKNVEFSALFKKKFKSLMIPYINFGICIMLIMFIIGGLSNELKTYIVYFATGVGRDALWFLPVLFIIEMLFNIISKINNRGYEMLVISLLFVIGLYGAYFINNLILTTIYRAFVGLGFYSLGSYTYNRLKNIDISYITLFLLFAISSILSIYNSCIDLWGLNFNNRFIYIICSMVNSLCIILLSKNIFSENISSKFLKLLGLNTLVIMSTQQVIINYVNKFTGTDYYNTLHGLVILALVILLEIPIIYLINNYCPWMLGKLNKKEKYIEEVAITQD